MWYSHVIFICDVHMWLFRLSYHELSELVSRFTGWGMDFVKDVAEVELYCSATRLGPGKERRTYWATEDRYNYNGGSRRDMVQVSWKTRQNETKIGCAQITGFIQIRGNVDHPIFEGVIIRWLDKSSLSTQSDREDRPLCDYPLSFNHYLWQWSKSERNRKCFTCRGFRNRVDREQLWNHIDANERTDTIRSEIRSRYDIVRYDSIICHVNVHRDPSTGHLLQTLQIV